MVLAKKVFALGIDCHFALLGWRKERDCCCNKIVAQSNGSGFARWNRSSLTRIWEKRLGVRKIAAFDPYAEGEFV